MSAQRNILCPIDFSPLSERSLRLAVEMCRRTGARLVLEHNLESPPPNYLAVGWMWGGEHEAQEQDKSRQAVARLEQAFAHIPEGVEYEAKITRGPLDEGILHLAKQLPAEMIVMGTHGPSDASHKSLTEGIVMRAPCPVLVTGESYQPESIFGVEGGPAPDKLSILIPFDFSSRSETALKFGLAMARRMPHRIHLLHVVEPAAQLAEMPVVTVDEDAVRKRLKMFVPPDLMDRIEPRVEAGEPVKRILEVAQEEGVLFILMAAHGKSLLKRFLFGTRTLGVLHGSRCPVWLLPPAAQRAVS
jgi:nucleotide-binding universal stress UspA family protein